MEGEYILALPSLRKLGVEGGGSNPLIRLLLLAIRPRRSLLNNPTGKNVKQAHISVPKQVEDIYVGSNL